MWELSFPLWIAVRLFHGPGVRDGERLVRSRERASTGWICSERDEQLVRRRAFLHGVVSSGAFAEGERDSFASFAVAQAFGGGDGALRRDAARDGAFSASHERADAEEDFVGSFGVYRAFQGVSRASSGALSQDGAAVVGVAGVVCGSGGAFERRGRGA